MKSYVDLWQWYDNSVRNAYRAMDPQRMQFSRLHERMWEIKEKDPGAAFSLCERAVRLAQQLQEPCWELFHAYWASEMQIYYVGDIDNGLDYAIRNVAKAHQEAYRDCPIRSRVYITLIGVYSRIDPVGYADEINEMVGFIDAEIPMDRDTHQRLQYYRAWMHVEFERYDDALDELMRYMDMCSYSAFRQQSGFGLLTYIDIDRKRYASALGYAEQYEAAARRAEFETGTVMGLLWRAALERKLGDEVTSARLLRSGLARAQGVELENNAGYYNALASYYEAGGDFEKSVEMRDDLIRQFQGTERIALLAEANLQRCRVRRRMGELIDADIETTRAIAAKLKNPKLFLENLEKVQQGEQIRGSF